jgi:hypothetical protein
MLRDLVSFWEIGIEVIFPGKMIIPFNFAMTGQTHPDGELDGLAVEFGQRAGVSQGDRADMSIGFSAETGAVAAEKFRPGKQLRVHFEAHHYFVCIIIN